MVYIKGSTMQKRFMVSVLLVIMCTMAMAQKDNNHHNVSTIPLQYDGHLLIQGCEGFDTFIIDPHIGAGGNLVQQEMIYQGNSVGVIEYVAIKSKTPISYIVVMSNLRAPWDDTLFNLPALPHPSIVRATGEYNWYIFDMYDPPGLPLFVGPNVRTKINIYPDTNIEVSASLENSFGRSEPFIFTTGTLPCAGFLWEYSNPSVNNPPNNPISPSVSLSYGLYTNIIRDVQDLWDLIDQTDDKDALWQIIDDCKILDALNNN